MELDPLYLRNDSKG